MKTSLDLTYVQPCLVLLQFVFTNMDIKDSEHEQRQLQRATQNKRKILKSYKATLNLSLRTIDDHKFESNNNITKHLPIPLELRCNARSKAEQIPVKICNSYDFDNY